MAELKFSKATDEEHEIELESYLIYARWRSGYGYIGHTVEFEIGTSFVGNGAKIKVKGNSEGGTKLGKVSSEIKNNKFIGSFEIPDKIENGDEIYFEVELSQNGLDGESERIPVFLPPIVSNLKWSADEARRGDTLTLTAEVKEVATGADVTVTIYEYDQDGVHDKITEIPATIEDEKMKIFWEYEYHEDTDEVPTQEEMERYGGSYNPPEYFFTIKVGNLEFGKDQESGLLLFKDWIDITLKDDLGNPVPDADYVITLPDGQEKKGKLDANGNARIDGIPPGEYRYFFPNMPET